MNTEQNSPNIFLTLLFVVALGGFLAFLFFLPEYSSFSAAILKVSIGITLLVLADKFLLTNIDLIDELQKGNIAVGLMLLAYSIIIAAALLAS
jgi:hypothetical protein